MQQTSHSGDPIFGIRRSLVLLALAFFLFTSHSLFAQTPISFQYVNDPTGQLVKAVDSTGVTIDYVYDAVGNILEIDRSKIASDGVSIFSFFPLQGPVGTVVSIWGQNF